MTERLRKIQVEIFLLIISTVLVEKYHALDGNITVTCGQLVVHGYNFCEIEHNDKKIHYVGPEEQVFSNLFGFITYDCDEHGEPEWLASNYNCTECGFPCSSEEQCHRKPKERLSYTIAFWSGTISGLFVAALITSFVFRHVHRPVDPFGRRRQSALTATLLGEEVIFTEETAPYDEQTHSRRGPSPSTSLKALVLLVSIALQILNACCEVFHMHAEGRGNFTGHSGVHGLGQCEMKILTIYSCSSCNDRAYVVLVPESIVSHGLMFFVSDDCIFDKKTVHCEHFPTKLLLKGRPEACSMKIDGPVNNSNISFHLQYPDLSHPLKSYDETVLLDSEFLSRFFTAFLESALMLTVFGLIVTITLRIIRPY